MRPGRRRRSGTRAQRPRRTPGALRTPRPAPRRRVPRSRTRPRSKLPSSAGARPRAAPAAAAAPPPRDPAPARRSCHPLRPRGTARGRSCGDGPAPGRVRPSRRRAHGRRALPCESRPRWRSRRRMRGGWSAGRAAGRRCPCREGRRGPRSTRARPRPPPRAPPPRPLPRPHRLPPRRTPAWGAGACRSRAGCSGSPPGAEDATSRPRGRPRLRGSHPRGRGRPGGRPRGRG